LREKDVEGLNVSMDDMFGVEVLERGAQLGDEAPHLGFRKVGSF